MQIARVIGDVVAARKAGGRHFRTAVLVQPLELDGENKGRATVALNEAGASVGQVVLLVREASAASESPGDAAVIAIVDRVELFPVAAGTKDK
ncbi:MAG TPA: EutN/CcmL family microcompartment protein [Bryobacteraceae bacterium]|jgi:ethanolamine utilization protein EutN